MIPIKNAREIEMMREAGRLAAEVLARTAKLVRPGVSTKEVDSAAAEFMAELDCKSAFYNYRGFPGQICISLNEEVVHGIGSTRRLRLGDIVKLDIGIVKDGWVGDNATTVAVGPVDAQTQQLMSVTEASLHAAIAQAVDGGRLGDIGAAVEETVVAAGFSVVRDFVGHGVGRKLHEEPQVPNFGRRGSGVRLRAGMTLAIEPMVNIGTGGVRILEDGWTVITRDGKNSSHYEHTVLITKDGPEILTRCNRS